MLGYIQLVSPASRSRKNNTFFDAQLKTQNDMKRIRVMCNVNISRTSFMAKCEAKSPVKLTGLSPVSNALTFFNSNTGSRLLDVESIPLIPGI